MLAFVHIEKCGGTTLIDLLRRNFFLDHVDVIPRDHNSMLLSAYDLTRLLRLRPSTISIAGHSVRVHADLESCGQPLVYYTCLRNPVKRFVSDYLHFAELLGYRNGIDQFLHWGERNNFQTRAIAGEADVAAAQQILAERFAVVGLLEQFDDFLQDLSAIVRSHTGHEMQLDYQIRNTRSDRSSQSEARTEAESRTEAIAEANALDMQLYEFVERTLLPSRRAESSPATIPMKPGVYHRGLAARVVPTSLQPRAYTLYRNMIYKPYMGYWPGPHRLPVYREQLKAS